MLQPIRAHAFEACVEQLAGAIRLGVYPAGSALPTERELAAGLALSRATVREAIAALRAAGMVTTQRGRSGGTVVTYQPPGPHRPEPGWVARRRRELADSLQFRRVVEPGAALIAAGRTLPTADRNRLVDYERRARSTSDDARRRQADSRFHLAIAAATESPRIAQTVMEVQTALHEMLIAIPVLGRNIRHSNQQHAAILAAILDGRSLDARRMMEKHCDDTAALLRALIGFDTERTDGPTAQPVKGT